MPDDPIDYDKILAMFGHQEGVTKETMERLAVSLRGIYKRGITTNDILKELDPSLDDEALYPLKPKEGK